MRGIYEPIVLHCDGSQQSIFAKNSKIMVETNHMNVQTENVQRMTSFLEKLHKHFLVVGQVLSANNQCTHVSLAKSNVLIPLEGICVPLKNDATKFIPVIPHHKCHLVETYEVLKHISSIFPKYTPEALVYDIRNKDEKVVYAIRVMSGIYCDVNEMSIDEAMKLFDNVSLENNIQLREPYYPGTR